MRAIARAVSIAATCLVAVPCFAQKANVAPWMTGAALVKLLGSVDTRNVHWTPDSPFKSPALAAQYLDMANGEIVHGYIQGVHDATEGKSWCWSERHRPLAHELEIDARNALQRMSDEQLKRNAADLIVEVWRARWPCRMKGREQQ